MAMQMQEPPAPQGEGGGEQQAMIRQKLVELLSQAAAIARKNNIPFEEILMQFMQGQQGGAGKPPAPRPPMGMGGGPAGGGPMMGGM